MEDKSATVLVPVVVCTDKKGVFFGYCADISAPTLVLLRARNCIYWHASIGGVLGLAAEGPNPNCRIGTVADIPRMDGITAVFACSAAAVQAWESAPVYRG